MGVIYKIENIINNACYIGSSIGDGRLRWNRHKTSLNNNKHHSKYLQRAWNKYGKDNFKFLIIQNIKNITQNELYLIEQNYLDDRKLNYPNNLNYNMYWKARGGCTSTIVSKEAREKMSKSHLGVKLSEKHINSLIESWTNKSKNEYILISPDNKEHKFKNIRKFCREHNICQASINLLLKNKIYYYKGWIKDYSHSYAFINPEGIIFNKITNLTKFCNEHNLKMKGMSKLHRGYCKSYFGWKKL